VRRPSVPLLVILAMLLLAGCPTDKGSRSAISSTTSSTPPSTGGSPGSSIPTTPGGADPGAPRDPRVPPDVPPFVVLGGTKLQALVTATGQLVDLPRPTLGNGLQVVGLLERAQGLVTVVRGPLPQDPGAVYVLFDASHQPRVLGTGATVVAGASDHEVWIADPPATDGLTSVRHADIGQEVQPQVQRLPRGRSLAGFGAGGLVLGVAPDPDGQVIGPVDVMDPVKGNLARRLATSGAVIAADGQRAVVLVDAACTQSCTLRVASASADRSYDLPTGLVPEPGGATAARVTAFIGRTTGGPRHIWVLSLIDGTARDTGLAIPPEAGLAPMTLDAQGTWAFTRSGPSTLVAVNTTEAEAIALPWPLEPWNAVAVTAGGTCPCQVAGGGSTAPVV
jgi:hypothetical protein